MKGNLTRILSFFLLLTSSFATHSAPCVFDASKDCQLQRDILHDRGSDNLPYFAPTVYDSRPNWELNVYDATYVNLKDGLLKLITHKGDNGIWLSGEIMTRANLDQPPYNAPVKSHTWTTKEAKHGYLEVVAKMARCDISTDNLCQSNSAPFYYQQGLFPAIWLMPTNDTAWPADGEIDMAEAYQQGSDFKSATAAVHFNGKDPKCTVGDCVGPGFPLSSAMRASTYLFSEFHRWGFEWQPDPQSQKGGHIITGYLDNHIVWGPLRTDTLPADGPSAYQRGFNNPNGGYYLIINLAIGSLYAGNPNPHVTDASMMVQSILAYTVK